MLLFDKVLLLVLGKSMQVLDAPSLAGGIQRRASEPAGAARSGQLHDGWLLAQRAQLRGARSEGSAQRASMTALRVAEGRMTAAVRAGSGR